MSKVKYRDAKYLCRYDLDTNFFEELSLNIKDLWPTRNIFILDCGEGKKILKIINYDEKKLDFIVLLLGYLKKNYEHVLNINKFKDGSYIVEREMKKYILLELIEGVECNLNNLLDIDVATNGIANLHLAGRGILNHINNDIKSQISLGNLKDRFVEGLETIKKCKELALMKKYKNEFDELFLDNVEENIKSMNEAITRLDNSNYNKLCTDEKIITVCHNDLAYHNIIINNGKANFIDFDYANIDLRALDIFNFTIKTLKKHAFDYEIYKRIIDEYEKVSKISEDEFELIKTLMIYPSDFNTIVKNYYFSLKDWKYESFLNKLENKILYKKEKLGLLEKL